MPREHKSRRDVLDAIRDLPPLRELLSQHDGHFNHELDLEVTVYGRNYGGKKVGPYLRLLTYEPGEAVMTEGEWGGNTFYIVIDGHVDVWITAPNNQDIKVAELKPGTQVGEMSVLAGVPRSATVKAPPDSTARLLEIQRPALRLLRKLNVFGESLDISYREHSRDSVIEDLKGAIKLTDEMVTDLRAVSTFRVFSKNHVLVREKTTIDRLYLIKQGWLKRAHDSDGATDEDFLGGGFCFGIEGVGKNVTWPYSVTLMGRTEALEISIGALRQRIVLRETLVREIARFAPPKMGACVSSTLAVRERQLAAQHQLITTGLVDATNLLVMDMDLCVRCGNCSLACHTIHGHSRLLRRGLQVIRLKAPQPSAIQSVLSPAVCMHCQDPECLSGCPTGAIGRFTLGQIDIDPMTCIGCGDCASQCPYNAISLIPRQAKPQQARSGFKEQLREYLRITPEQLPSTIDTTEDLVAVKCNLCSDRATLNPPGSKTRAYSCEENCPTGALARVNPIEYFTEIGAIQGLTLLDYTHATGRNIHKSDPPKRASHIAGILLTGLLTATAIIGLRNYGLGERLAGFLNMRWITGLVGLIAIAGVMTYPVRRQMYKRRAGPLRYWLLSHTYLGVIAGIMILMHGGTESGGALTTLLMISFDLVIFTGLLGIFLYLVVPRLMTKIEGAPLLIDDLRLRREELHKQLAEIGSLPSEPLRTIVKNKVIPRFVSLDFLLRQYVKRESLEVLIESATKEFNSVIVGLKNDTDREKLERAVEASATLRRVDALVYLHRLLKIWLAPHVVTTSLMLALMVLHIIQVIYYAAR
jgi:Fe-S-cluster-containing dehydrogenase component/CRP-like cAMP-binding protein